MTGNLSSPRMPLVTTLTALAEARTNEIVVTSMGSAREWPKLSRHPLDFHYIPSTMGGAAPLGLGIALARPEREVIVLSGDGSLLMNLGGLATIAAAGAANFTLVVFDNGVYEVTGGQRTVGGAAGVDYAAVARASGIASVYVFDELSAWQKGVPSALIAPGPRVVGLKVEPDGGGSSSAPPAPIAERAVELSEALAR